MASFGGKLSIEKAPVGDTEDVYTVNQPLTFVHDMVLIAVLSGFKTDGASVPAAFRWFVSPFAGAHAPAAVIHDALYATHYTTRKWADEAFLAALEECGVGWFKRYAMYAAVRVGGSSPWEKSASCLDDAVKQREFVNADILLSGGSEPSRIKIETFHQS